MSENPIILYIFGFIALIIVINLFKFLFDFFANRKRYQEAYAVHEEVNTKVRPYLTALEKKFEKDEEAGEKFGTYVFNLFRNKISSKNDQLVEKAICKCCSDYEGAECKEDFCLQGSGASCAS